MVRLTLSRSSPPLQRLQRKKLFLPLLGEIFVNQRVLLQLDVHWRQLNQMQRICGPFVLKTLILNHFSFQRLFVLCTHSLDLCILFKFVLLYLRMHSAPFLRFSHILLTPILLYVYCHAECFFFYPRWCRWLAKARNLIYKFLTLAVKGLTSTILYFLTFIVLNFHKI